jgi:hypothetical protein
MMQRTKRRVGKAICRNCDAPTIRLARVVRVTPSGQQIHLAVCTFCYLQLRPKAKRPGLPL